MNIVQHLATPATRHPQRIALIDADANSTAGGRLAVTYGELWQRVRRVAGGLLARGLKNGDRVALLMPNSLEYVESFLGIAAAGLVAVPMNIRLLESELLHMLRDSGARLLIAQDALFAGREALVGVTELGVAVMRAAGPFAAPKFPYESLADAAPVDPVAKAPEDLASLMYTSGTTGLPKGVMLPHRSWTAVADETRRLLEYGDAEITLHAAPLTHGAGFMLLPTLANAGTNIVISRFEPARVLQLMRAERVTNSFLVPSMIQMLLDTPDPGAANSSSNSVSQNTGSHPDLKSIYYAGSPIDPGTLKGALARFGLVLVQSFGQMESPMFFTLMDRKDHARIADGSAAHLIRSAGCAIPGVKVRIVDDDGSDLPQGEAGEIAVQAPQTMLGYWNRPEATAESIRNGWLHTGDVGRFDADGYLYIVDRKKDMIISGGSNVYAREVEEALLGLKGIKEAAVIGLPHPKWGEMVTAVLVSESGAPIDDATLIDYCRSHLPDYRRPKRFTWIASLPRNAYGKVLKRELRKNLLEADAKT